MAWNKGRKNERDFSPWPPLTSLAKTSDYRFHASLSLYLAYKADEHESTLLTV